MKRVLWASVATICSTSLDEAINPHDCEKLALNILLERAGFEVWLLEPFAIAKKQSSYPRKVNIEEAESTTWDLIVFNAPGGGADQILGGPWNSPKVERICDFLIANRDVVMLLCCDPRPAFTNVLNGIGKRRPHRLYELLETLPVLVPAHGLLTDKKREVIAEYWKLINFPILPFNPNPEYGSVYVGVKKQTTHRKKALKLWHEHSTDGYTAGPIKLNEIESLSNFQPIGIKEALDYNSRSKTVFVTGEPIHSWLTPRAIQAFVCGSIASISSDFPGRHWIAEGILAEQTCDRLIDFNEALRTEAVYARQVEFVRSLAESAKPLDI